MFKAQEEFLFARGWKKVGDNLYQPQDLKLIGYGSVWFDEDGYSCNYAVKIERQKESRIAAGIHY